MVKRLSIISFVLLLLAGFGYAATKSTSSKSLTKSSTMKQEGTIEKIDFTRHTVVVQVGSNSKTFKFSDKTMWMSDGKKVKSVDLKVGNKVAVYSDSKNVARRIEASPHTS